MLEPPDASRGATILLAMTVTDQFDKTVESHPEAIYVRCGDHSLTFQEAYDESNRWANAFAAAGLSIGDRAAVLSKNNLESVLAYLGAFRAGVVPVPLNYRIPMPKTTSARLQLCRADREPAGKSQGAESPRHSRRGQSAGPPA